MKLFFHIINLHNIRYLLNLNIQLLKCLMGILVSTLIFSTNVFAQIPPQNLLPGSVEPAVVSRVLTQETAARQEARPAAPKTEEPPQPSGTLGPAAQKITFKLTQVTITGNCVYSTAELSKLWVKKLNKTITVADFVKIVQDITNYYRNNGYILSRAILPPQKIKAGQVKIRIIEGYIDKVKVVGCKRAECILLKYGHQISKCRPLTLKRLEYYLRLANELSGLKVKGVLEASKTAVGASDLNLVIEDYKRYNANVSYDNYGSRYLGPQQVTLYGSVNGLVTGGDIASVTYIQTTRPLELKYINGQYTLPLGCEGMKFTGGANTSETRPGLNLRPLEIVGLSTTYFGYYSYPLIREKNSDLTLNWGFDYLDSGVTTFGQRLYMDHLRSLQVGFDYNLADKYEGTNFITGLYRQGTPLFGATHSTDSFTTSRFGGVGTYSKVTLQASRLQNLNKHWSALILVKGQYAFNPLLAAEQFTVGGSIIGRGYDPAEIIGDRGAAGIAELRMTVSPSWKFLQMYQLYGFYDVGEIWNIKNLRPLVFKSQSIASTGFGCRFTIVKNFFGTVYVAQPLTKKVTAQEIIGRGKRLRGFLSLTATI